MEKLSEIKVLKIALNSYNKMCKNLGYELGKKEDFILENTIEENFSNRAFHIDNGVYSLKSGTLYSFYIAKKDSDEKYIITQYLFNNNKSKISIDYI